MRPEATSNASGAGHPLVPLDDLVELDVEAGRELGDHAAPRRGEDAGRQDERHLVDRLAEAHDVEQHLGLVVGGVVEDLHAAHLVDALADAGQHERQPVVGEAGVDAVDPQRHAALLGRGRPTPRYIVLAHGAPRVLEEHGAGRHDVDARPQEPLEVGDGLEQPVSAHAVWTMQSGRRASSASASSVAATPELAAEAGQRAGVDADLVGVRHPHADELELGPGGDAGDGVAPDVAGAPLHHSVGHVRPPPHRPWRTGPT